MKVLSFNVNLQLFILSITCVYIAINPLTAMNAIEMKEHI